MGDRFEADRHGGGTGAALVTACTGNPDFPPGRCTAGDECLGDNPFDAAPDGGSSISCIEPQPLELVVGTSAADGTGFIPLKGGEQLPLIYGTQGGFHIWTQVRVRTTCHRSTRLVRRVTLESGSEINLQEDERPGWVRAADPRLAQEGWWQLPFARPTFMCPNSAEASVESVLMTLHVDVEPETGPLETASLDFTVACPEGVLAEVCQRLCAD